MLTQRSKNVEGRVSSGRPGSINCTPAGHHYTRAPVRRENRFRGKALFLLNKIFKLDKYQIIQTEPNALQSITVFIAFS